MYNDDNRIVLTLDAGGTNFEFSAIKSCKQIITPIIKPAITDNLNSCLKLIEEGFTLVKKNIGVAPSAISFAFPGPADYENGVIGDLPNFPAFKGGVALADFLKDRFHIPVFINNDGNLFAYGEAIAGTLPYINNELKKVKNPKIYRNLIGITLGTGFGAGIVIDNNLLKGDNGCGGDVWLMRNKKYPNLIVEESVSIRAVIRVYEQLTNTRNSSLTPLDIFNIAEGEKNGVKYAAIKSFEELGEIAANSLIHVLDIIDGILVIGGGLAGAYKYFLPSMVKEFRQSLFSFSGQAFPVLQMDVFDLTSKESFDEFIKNETEQVEVPFKNRKVNYEKRKKIGIIPSILGTSKAISVGAYAYALHELDKKL